MSSGDGRIPTINGLYGQDGATFPNPLQGQLGLIVDAGAWKAVTPAGVKTALGGSSVLTLQQASIVLGGAATTQTISGLAGDTDEFYRIVMELLSGSATNGTVELRPNGSTTTVFYSGDGEDAAGGGTLSAVASESSTTKAVVGYVGGGAAQDSSLIIVDCWVKSGRGRTFSFVSAMNRLTASALQRNTRGQANWSDTAANITSIDVVAQQANGLGAGSIITVYKLARA